MKKFQVTVDHVFYGEYREIKPNDLINFDCTGVGRNKHCSVTAKISKINKKSFKATELDWSYNPGKEWIVELERDLTILEFSKEWNLKYNGLEFNNGDLVRISEKYTFDAGKKGTVIGKLESGQYRILINQAKIDISPLFLLTYDSSEDHARKNIS